MNRKEYLRGLNYLSVNIGAPIGQYTSSDMYFEKIADSVEKLTQTINANKGNNQGIPQLGGFLAEIWHTGTFNIDAAVKKSGYEAIRLDSHEFASADISLIDNVGSKVEDFNLKYYGTPAKTANAITMDYEGYYKKNLNGFETIYEFYKKRNHSFDDNMRHKSIYSGQYGLVPSDQYERLKEYIKRQIEIEKLRRPELVEKLEEALKDTVAKIKGPDGTESIYLTKHQAEELARAAKNGLFKPEDFGLTLDLLVDNSVVFKRAIKAGASASLVTALMKTIPFLISSLKNADVKDAFTWENFAEYGIEIFSTSGKSFVIGAFTSAINDMCKKKVIPIGEITPEILGSLVALTISITEQFIKASIGKINYSLCISNCLQNIYISLFGIAGSMLLATIPAGIIIGNILGSIIGGFTYNVSNKIFLSFCAESGFSCFGLVEQDYILPDKVLKDIGLDLAEFDLCEFDESGLDTCEFDECDFDENEFDTSFAYIIKRGVIEVNKIGYMII